MRKQVLNEVAKKLRDWIDGVKGISQDEITVAVSQKKDSNWKCHRSISSIEVSCVFGSY